MASAGRGNGEGGVDSDESLHNSENSYFSRKIVAKCAERATLFLTKSKPSDSGFDFERRSKGACEVFTQSVSYAGKRNKADFATTKVKLKRAQGECLGIRSRRRT